MNEKPEMQAEMPEVEVSEIAAGSSAALKLEPGLPIDMYEVAEDLIRSSYPKHPMKIMQHAGLSHSAVQNALKALEAVGMVRRLENGTWSPTDEFRRRKPLPNQDQISIQ